MITVNEATFSQEVLASPTPVLVNFWAPWCGLCRLTPPLLSKLQTDWKGQLKLVSINADENFKLSNTYRLTSLPTILLLDGGVVIQRFEGFHSHDELRTASQEVQRSLEASASYRYTA